MKIRKAISFMKTNFISGWLLLLLITTVIYLFARLSHMWIGTPQSQTSLNFASMPLVVVLLSAGILIPGIVVAAFLEVKGYLKKIPDGSMFVFSIIFFIVQYTLLDVILIRALKVSVPDWAFSAGYIISLSGLFYAGGAEKIKLSAIDIVQRNRASISTYLLLIATCAMIAGSVARDPFRGFGWRNISQSDSGGNSKVTFKVWKSHDNYFQYINGVIIAKESETFKYHYRRVGGSRFERLGYLYQDRVMLGGVIWSVIMRTFHSPHYMTYTLLGICLNAFIVFPLFSLGREHLKTPYLPVFLAAIIVSPFFLIHIYFTWFKFTGAAFFIFGVLLILKNRSSWRCWAAAGMCWGVGANFHAGTALAYPLFTLLLLYFAVRETNWKQSLKLPLVLFGTFVLLMVPWQLVKAFVFPPRPPVLFNLHFLHGHNSIAGFLNEYPLDTQIPYRLERLWTTLRFESIGDMFSEQYTVSIIAFVERWTWLEVLYIVIPLYPLALFALCGCINAIMSKDDNALSLKETIVSNNSLIGITALASVVALVFAKHARWQPDYSLETSMGVIIILQAVLLSAALRGPSWLRIGLVLYVGMSAIRIVTILTS